MFRSASVLAGADQDHDEVDQNVLDSQHVHALKPDLWAKTTGSLVLVLAGLEQDAVPLPVAFTSKAYTPLDAVADYISLFTELLSTEYVTGRANLISVSSIANENVLSIPGVSRVVLKADVSSAVVSVPDNTTPTFKSKAKAIAKSSYLNVQKSFDERFGSSVLKESDKINKLFMVEMNFISSFCEAVNEQSSLMLQPQVDGFMSDYMAISLTRLYDIVDVYGKESQEYEAASKVLQQVATKVDQVYIRFIVLTCLLTLFYLRIQVVDTFKSIYPAGLIQILSVAPSSASLRKRDTTELPDLSRRLAKVDASCPLYFSDCMTLNNNCSNHGSCSLMPNPRSANQSCYFCSCFTNNTDDNGELIIGGAHRKVHWTGDQCSKQDISPDFHLLLWTSVGLIVALIFIIGLLASVGSDDAGLQGAGAGKKKDD
ncbi:UNVERIFIED_CONTAM: hypothetical protein HDU68_004028 [Siphonaria sp. JEL0065]|nr:hypothetical protein HDU68_004028 [Siphonaria sp. JEL0065]